MQTNNRITKSKFGSIVNQCKKNFYNLSAFRKKNWGSP